MIDYSRDVLGIDIGMVPNVSARESDRPITCGLQEKATLRTIGQFMEDIVKRTYRCKSWERIRFLVDWRSQKRCEE